jgi:DNA-binding GntR family transcriptional regulator
VTHKPASFDNVTEANEAEASVDISLREQVYDNLRYRLITGSILPGVAISTRGLAQQLGVSQTPVRDALSRLAADGAVEIRSKRAIMVPIMSRDRFRDVIRCRTLLEPAAAVDALPFIDGARIKEIGRADAATERALKNGDIIGYIESNFRFHALIYRANPMGTLYKMIETLWMQTGPFMRSVYGRMGTAKLIDQHQLALQAIEQRNGADLHAAITADIMDGLDLIESSDLQ